MARNDPYMNDPNIRGASNFLSVAWMGLGAGIGAAASGWFAFPAAVGIVAGIAVGLLFGSLTIRYYGGRATR